MQGNGSKRHSDRMQRLCLAALAALLSTSASTSAHAREDIWNPEHISQLPAEVRGAVMHMCGHPPLAAHYFATYFDNSRMIKLHFEHFRCDGGLPFCNQSGCLHQKYVLTGGQYRLLRSFYAPSSD